MGGKKLLSKCQNTKWQLKVENIVALSSVVMEASGYR